MEKLKHAKFCQIWEKSQNKRRPFSQERTLHYLPWYSQGCMKNLDTQLATCAVNDLFSSFLSDTYILAMSDFFDKLVSLAFDAYQHLEPRSMPKPAAVMSFKVRTSTQKESDQLNCLSHENLQFQSVQSIAIPLETS